MRHRTSAWGPPGRSIAHRRLSRAARAGLVAAGLVSPACIDTARVATCPVPVRQDVPKACVKGTRPADDGLINDFEDGRTQLVKAGDRNGYWFTSHDPNGSTLDPDPFAVTTGGAGGSAKALRVFGQTSNVGGAWGAMVGATFVGEGIYDASMYAGISFKAKAGSDSTKIVRFKVADVNTHPDGGVCKACWNHFGKDVELTTEWREYKVSFVDMKQEPGWGDPFPVLTTSKLVTINWSYGPGRVYDLWLDDIQFFDCQ
jgi:hypothetical protein